MTRVLLRVLRAALLAVLFVSAGAPAFAQLTRAADEGIAREVAERLASRGIAGVDIAVEYRIVTLRGIVPTLWMKQRAIDQAARVDDVVTVVSELRVARGESDRQVAEEIAGRMHRYVFFTIFDDAGVEVHDGVATLTGRVTMPHKADALGDLAAQVPGVQEVRNEIRALPVSRFDDQLRYAVARQIYGDSLFTRYALQPNPPVHIVVEHGAVTLAGVVHSNVERRAAEAIARTTFGVMSVTNALRVEWEP